MREGKFIKQNKDRWESYAEDTDNPDTLADRFTNLVDDLSYSKTFYPYSKTVKYLNAKASAIYLSIYNNKKEKSHRFLTFWTRELPAIFYRQRKTLLFAFLFFSIFTFIGYLSADRDINIVRSILSDAYVDRTEQSIAEGDPFRVYKTMSPLMMFLYIAFNNIKVALLTFASGILTPVFTFYMLFSNGVMVGAFSYLFASHHLGKEFILVVMIHGTLELSAISIAGAAGIILGNGFLFPGTFTRTQSLRMAAKDAVKIMVSLMPIILTAAFFESYITRHTNMPLFASLSILIGSAVFIVGYFFIYPFFQHQKIVATQNVE